MAGTNRVSLRVSVPLVITVLWTPLALAQQPSPFHHPATDPSHDLTTKEFFKDIPLNFKALVSLDSILPVMAGGLATGLAAIPEQDLEKHFAPGDVWGAWAAPGKYIGNPAILGGISGVLFAASRSSSDRRFRSLSYALIHGSIMSSTIVHSIKYPVGRLRPNGEDHRSFPSGHSTDSFMYATVFAEHYGWKAAVPGYLVASYVAATRLVDRKHHLTDVAAGAGLGYLIGRTVSRRMRTGSEPKVSWQVRPSRRGVACVLRVRLP